MIQVTTMSWVPPQAQGYVRDLSVRWALEEAGLPYEVRLIDREEQSSASYRKRQPFGQVPVYEEDGLILFESGAIVLHIAEKSAALLSTEPHARARAKSWMFAAMNSIDPLVKSFEQVEWNLDQEWARLRRPALLEVVYGRLQLLADALGDRLYLDESFTAADLLMAMVLRNLGSCEAFQRIPALVQYVQRCEGRAAFQAALAKHMSTFTVAR